MLNWLKFFPFEWRDDNKPKEIRGPYFSTLKKNKWFLQDCALHFSTPSANPVFGFRGRGSSVNAVLPDTANILTTQWPWVTYGGPDSPLSEWNAHHFYSNTWYFVGPWFTGEQARLRAHAVIFTAKEASLFLDKNLFHPRIFESAITNFLDKAYGYKKNNRKPRYRGPLNWRVLAISPSIQAVVCDIHDIRSGSKETPLLQRFVFVPITPQRFIRINFDFGGTDIYHDEIRAKPLFELCDSIIDSLRLEVGESTQAEWDKVKASCPDMSISETFGELPWPLKFEKSSKKSKEVDITPSLAGLAQQGNESDSL